MTDGVLDFQERDGLTIWGLCLSAQWRDAHMALHIMDGAPRSVEDYHPALIPIEDVRKLKALLEEVEKRGEL